MNKWFSLPRIGAEYFAEIRRARVAYDSKFGFKLTPETDLESVLSILSRALGEDYELRASCFVCDGPLGDGEKAGTLLCSGCASSDDAYVLYTMKFAALMDRM